jgi:nucleoside-diphosphate-sugar epimerase
VKVMLTGSDGYLGCLTGPKLVRAGHDVSGVDSGFYRAGWLYGGVDLTVRTLHRDVRRLATEDLQGFDAVVHMAELSNDPLGDLLGKVTYAVNHEGSVQLARLSKAAGVSRFVHMSSCSVYGVATGTVDESSPVTPQTAYAKCKLLVERDVTALADDTFSPTFLRNATAFGASPRMRFDIVLNNLSGLAWTTGEIAMSSDGSPWRPLVHALDIAEAVRCVLDAPREAVHAQVLNVGSDVQNYRVREIADRVAAAFPGCSTSLGARGADNRSYRVDFSKIGRVLPEFRCSWDADSGARQLREVFSHVRLDNGTFTGRGHTRLAQLEHLLRTGQLDPDLFWTSS